METLIIILQIFVALMIGGIAEAFVKMFFDIKITRKF
jgi:hypothetical protein